MEKERDGRTKGRRRGPEGEREREGRLPSGCKYAVPAFRLGSDTWYHVWLASKINHAELDCLLDFDLDYSSFLLNVKCPFPRLRQSCRFAVKDAFEAYV